MACSLPKSRDSMLCVERKKVVYLTENRVGRHSDFKEFRRRNPKINYLKWWWFSFQLDEKWLCSLSLPLKPVATILQKMPCQKRKIEPFKCSLASRYCRPRSFYIYLFLFYVCVCVCAARVFSLCVLFVEICKSANPTIISLLGTILRSLRFFCSHVLAYTVHSQPYIHTSMKRKRTVKKALLK